MSPEEQQQLVPLRGCLSSRLVPETRNNSEQSQYHGTHNSSLEILYLTTKKQRRPLARSKELMLSPGEQHQLVPGPQRGCLSLRLVPRTRTNEQSQYHETHNSSLEVLYSMTEK